jgi:hypothetical protein
MKTSSLINTLLGAALLLSAGASQAAWNTVGDVVSAANGALTLTTANTDYDDDAPLPVGALNLSGNNVVEANVAGGMESYLGLASGALNTSAWNQATEGSLATSIFTVGAGDVLRFNWALSTRDSGAGYGLDYAFVVIDGALISLGDAAGATQAGTGSYLAQTGLNTFSYTFQRAGAYTLGLGVVDVLDYNNSSALTVSNLNVSAVPEPSGLAMLLAGLGLLGGWRARSR